MVYEDRDRLVERVGREVDARQRDRYRVVLLEVVLLEIDEHEGDAIARTPRFVDALGRPLPPGRTRGVRAPPSARPPARPHARAGTTSAGAAGRRGDRRRRGCRASRP